jgi:uncharacterized SAM-binding protein YcdF (DUF218 family)
MKISWSNLVKIISAITVIVMVITFTGIGIHLFVIPLENYANKVSNNGLDQIKDIPTVVLGGGINYNVNGNQSELSSISRDRLLKGIFIAKKNNQPLIYTGGVGVGYKNTSEADIALEFVKNFKDINFMLENKAKTTYENGLEIKKWLQNNQYDQIYLITSAIHMKRSIGVFDNLNIDYIPLVSNYSYSHKLSWLDYLPNRGCLRSNMQAIHEWIGLLWYSINNRI